MSNPGTSERLDNIDLLRAISVISVLIYHYTSRFPAEFYRAAEMPFSFSIGSFGVDVFFAVSGYCIFMTMRSSRTVGEFLAKRLSRIQPAYMAAATLTFVVVSIFGLPERSISPVQYLGNLVWLTFIPSWPMVDGAYWSLVVELKFYFLFMAAYFLARGRDVSFWWCGLCSSCALLEFAAAFLHMDRSAAVRGILNVLIWPHSAMFLVGLVAWEARSGWNRRLVAAAAVCLACLAVSSRFGDVPGLGVAIGVFTFAMIGATRIRVPAAVRYIGVTSYSIYLVHQNIGIVVIREAAELVPSISARIVLAAIVSFLCAAFIHLSVELRWRKQLANLIQSLIAMIGGGANLTHFQPAAQSANSGVSTAKV